MRPRPEHFASGHYDIETSVAVLAGALYLNGRNYVGARRRALTWSHDDGLSFPRTGYEEALPEPI